LKRFALVGDIFESNLSGRLVDITRRSYGAVLQRSGFQRMSGPDNCYDDAFMESCFATMNRELELKPAEIP